MLYLKLAQLRGSLQHTRQESVELHEQFEEESRFRKSVAESAVRFKNELDVSQYTVLIKPWKNQKPVSTRYLWKFIHRSSNTY